MTQILDYLVNNGTPKETVILVLMVPLISFLIVFVRQVLGIKAFGIYTPLIVTFALVETKLKYGLAIFLLVLATAMISRIFLKRLRLLYLPRIAIVISLIAFVILAAFFEGAWHNRMGFINVSIFPILIMIVLMEQFVNIQIEKGDKEAIKLAIETIAMSVVGYFIVKNHASRDFVYNNWYISVLAIPLSAVLGKWKGLRLPEFWRFKNIWTE